MVILYSAMEDRLRSFLYYLGAFETEDTVKLSDRTKAYLTAIYLEWGDRPNRRGPSLSQVSGKVNLIRAVMKWTDEQTETPEQGYLKNLKAEVERTVDIGGVLETLNHIDQWCAYRNEIIHALMNKNLESVYRELQNYAVGGMEYVRFIDSEIKKLKKHNRIRKQTLSD